MDNQSNFKIVILDKGFVFIGRVEENEREYILSGAACIRNWGTKQGIGQLAFDGPTNDTKLDPIPNLRYPKGNFIIIIDVMDESLWSYRSHEPATMKI